MKESDKKRYRVVVIGGGTGTSQLLRGLKDYNLDLSAVVTTADTGGSSGVLRREIGMSPPGDVRQCFAALNEGAHPFIKFFNDRFSDGSLRGHSFGNLFFALLWQTYKDFPLAIKEAEKMVNATNKVIPVTHAPTNLVASLKNGTKVSTETNILKINKLQDKLVNLTIEPKGVQANRDAKSVISSADFIIIGPGNLVASLTPPLLVNSLSNAVIASRAKKILIVNLINQTNIAEGFEVDDYVSYFEDMLKSNIFDYVVYNSVAIPEKRLKALNITEEVVKINKIRDDIKYIGRSFASSKNAGIDKNDIMARTLIKHDEKKIARVIYEQIIKK